MRFLRRVLRASASAGESSSLRNSTLPFLPLRTLPSASAFSVRLADSRAAISPGEGLLSGAPGLPGGTAALAGPLPLVLTVFAVGSAGVFETNVGLRPIAPPRDLTVVLVERFCGALREVRSLALGEDFFFFRGALRARVALRGFAALRGLLNLVERRVVDLPPRDAGLRSAFFALTLRPCLEALREFFRGFDVFLAMIVLRVGADAGRLRRLQSSLVGGARENFKL